MKQRLILILIVAFILELALVWLRHWRQAPPVPPAPPASGALAEAQLPGAAGPSADHASVRWMDPSGWWVTCYGVLSYPSPDRRWRLVAVNFDYLTDDKANPSGSDNFVTLLATTGKELSPQEAWVLSRSGQGFHQPLCEVAWTADSRHCVFTLRAPQDRSRKSLYIAASDRIDPKDLRAHRVDLPYLRGSFRILDNGDVLAERYGSAADLAADADGERPELREKIRVNVGVADAGK